MRSQVVLIIPLALVAVLVMGLIVFLPTDPVIHTGPESEWPTPAKVVELNQAQLPSSLPEDLPSGIVSTATPGLESQTPGSPSGATGDAQAATAAVAQASPPAAATPTPPRAARARPGKKVAKAAVRKDLSTGLGGSTGFCTFTSGSLATGLGASLPKSSATAPGTASIRALRRSR